MFDIMMIINCIKTLLPNLVLGLCPNFFSYISLQLLHEKKELRYIYLKAFVFIFLHSCDNQVSCVNAS